jgi:hypothetical protein
MQNKETNTSVIINGKVPVTRQVAAAGASPALASFSFHQSARVDTADSVIRHLWIATKPPSPGRLGAKCAPPSWENSAEGVDSVIQ